MQEKLILSSGTPALLAATREIWKECFTDDEDYLDRLFSKCIPHTRTYGLCISGSIACTSTVIDLKSDCERFLYLYGVATSVHNRGKGLSSSLFKMILEEEQKRADWKNTRIITHPATIKLYDLYRSMGLTEELHYQSDYTILSTEDIENINQIPGMKIIDHESQKDLIDLVSVNMEKTSGKDNLAMKAELNGYAMEELLMNGYSIATDLQSVAVISAASDNGIFHIRGTSENSNYIVRKICNATHKNYKSERILYGLATPSEHEDMIPPLTFLME